MSLRRRCRWAAVWARSLAAISAEACFSFPAVQGPQLCRALGTKCVYWHALYIRRSFKQRLQALQASRRRLLLWSQLPGIATPVSPLPVPAKKPSEVFLSSLNQPGRKLDRPMPWTCILRRISQCCQQVIQGVTKAVAAQMSLGYTPNEARRCLPRNRWLPPCA